MRKVGEKYKEQLAERIKRKMETMQENREAQLNAITERIKEHVSFIYHTG